MIVSRTHGRYAAFQTGLRPSFKQPISVGNLSTSFPEPSGLARPTVAANRGYIWTEQDSGGPSSFLAVSALTGAASGSWTLQGVSQIDFEDCASANINGISYLYMSDAGDNGSARSTFIVYRCKEPTITGGDGTIVSGDIEAITCEFPGGSLPPHKDVECLLVDPDTGDMYFLTKRTFPSLCYKLAHASSYSGTQTTAYMGKVAVDTSATSLTIGTGSKTFTTVLGLPFSVGMRLRAQSRASTANWMEGEVTSISGTTLTFFVEVAGSKTYVGGSGTLSDWDITLATSHTPSGNNGCVTCGSIASNGSEIALGNYDNIYLWSRDKSKTIFQTLQQAPQYISGDSMGGGSFYSHNIPAFPQMESLEYDDSGVSLFAISEYIAASGTINPLLKFVRTSKPVTTVRLQQGLNGYSSVVDTYLGSATPATDQSAATSLVADIDFATATTFVAAVSASSGTMVDFTCPSSSTFVIGLGALITGSTEASYNGTWEVDSKPDSVTVRVKVSFVATASGAIQAHTQDRQVLIKFTDLSSIPGGSVIVNAKLRFYVNTEGKGFQIHRMLVAWAGSDTWNSMSAGVYPSAGIEAAAAKDAYAPTSAMDTYTGFFTVNLPVSTVQAWIDGSASNYGWAILQDELDLTGDGFQMDSSEGSTQTRRPMLIVSYQ